MPGGTDGEYEGVRYFDCEGHGLFLPVELVSKDDRFNSPASTPVTPLPSSTPPIAHSQSYCEPSATGGVSASPPQRSRSVGSTPASSSVPEPLLCGINLKAMGGVFETSECKFAIRSTIISIPPF